MKDKNLLKHNNTINVCVVSPNIIYSTTILFNKSFLIFFLRLDLWFKLITSISFEQFPMKPLLKIFLFSVILIL